MNTIQKMENLYQTNHGDDQLILFLENKQYWMTRTKSFGKKILIPLEDAKTLINRFNEGDIINDDGTAHSVYLDFLSVWNNKIKEV